MDIFELLGDDYRKYVADQSISLQKHPSLPYCILNYTQSTMFNRQWNPVTRQCRGLIFDDTTKTVVARPFERFFNYGEIPLREVPQNAPVVMEKLDGSLGIAYNTPEGPAVATRGSFASDQAVWATEWLRSHPEVLSDFDGLTPLVEIIYPTNRIVVDYGQRAELVLLGAIDIETGADVPLWECGFWTGATARQYPGINSPEDALRIVNTPELEGEEGFVLVWYKGNEPSFRLKIKGAEYVRLHRTLTNCSTLTIWNTLKNNEDIDEIIDGVPDEFFDWVHDTIDSLYNAFNEITDDVTFDADWIRSMNLPDRKSMAEAVKRTRHPGLLFSVLDGKDVSGKVWDMVRPQFQKPFANAGGLEDG